MINHFDQIVGHPKGADLLFYPAEDDYNGTSTGSVMYYVKDWHHKQGMPAFKGEGIPVRAPVAAWPSTALTFAQVTQRRIAHSLAEVQKVAVDVAASEQVVEPAFSLFERRIRHLRSQQSVDVDIRGREANIRSLETAEFESRLAIRRYEFWEMGLRFKREAAQRDLTYGRAEQAQWQNIVQQITATEARYLTTLSAIKQRLQGLQIEAEALLITAHTQLVRQRHLEGVGPTQAPGFLTAPLGFVNSRPSVLLNGALSQPLETHRIALQKAIRSAVAEFTWQITSATAAHFERYAAVLQFDFASRAETEVYGLSIPLVELLPIEGQDWQRLAMTRAEVDIPFRASSGSCSVPSGTLKRGLREITMLLQVALTPTNGNVLPSNVRVRAAVWDEHLHAFRFTADGVAPVTINWIAPDTLENIPDLAPAPEYRLGFLRSLPTPLFEPFSDIEATRFDDYVVVFPTDSGLDPLYVIFRDRREYPV
ncbi:S-type pyocin domain-containing protein [Pseudomonas sp. HLT2-19-2]